MVIPPDFLFRRFLVAAFVLWVRTSLVFFAIHLGPRNPAGMRPDEMAGDTAEQAAALEEKKETFGLSRPFSAQYIDYITDMYTFDFGESFTSRIPGGFGRAEPITDVNRLVFQKLMPRTVWRWGWSVLLAGLMGFPLGVALGYSDASWAAPGARVSGAVLKAAAVFILLTGLRTTLTYSNDLLFGFQWRTFIVESRRCLVLSSSRTSIVRQRSGGRSKRSEARSSSSLTSRG